LPKEEAFFQGRNPLLSTRTDRESELSLSYMVRSIFWSLSHC